ncbi:MAG: type II secretion system F family protein, partial [Bacteroidales bacterium]|nr:type II secretion system F family protein [Bacteroidales bacterium]
MNNQSSTNNLFQQKKKLKLHQRHKFFNELSILLNAGLDIKAAFSIISENLKENRYDKTIRYVIQLVISGSNLGDALKASGRFDIWEYKTIAIGEASGTLAQILLHIVDFQRKTLDQRKKLLNALTYPIVVVAIATGAVVFMIWFIVPMFTDIFQQYGQELPAITKTIIQIAERFPKKMPYLIITPGILFFIYLTYRSHPVFKKITGNIVIRTPLLKQYITAMQHARLFMMLELMEKSAVPLLQAFRMSCETTKFYPLKQELMSISFQIEQGKSLAEAMKSGRMFKQQETA